MLQGAGSVAGLGGDSPTGDPATEPDKAQLVAVERSAVKVIGKLSEEAQRLPKVDSPKSPPAGPTRLPPAI